MTRCVLLDRDGVLNADLPGSVRTLSALVLLPGAAAAVARLSAGGYRVLVVTNQACVGRGDCAADELARIHQALAQAVAAAGGSIDGWYVCTHTAGAGCACRKPRPGLIDQARREHGFDPARTCLVGDAASDVAAALAAGCRPLLVRTGKPLPPLPGVPVYDHLGDAADALLAGSAP